MPFRMPPLTEPIDPNQGVAEGGVSKGWTTVEGDFVLADVAQARKQATSHVSKHVDVINFRLRAGELNRLEREILKYSMASTAGCRVTPLKPRTSTEVLSYKSDW